MKNLSELLLFANTHYKIENIVATNLNLDTNK